jgi:hypothetical protein
MTLEETQYVLLQREDQLRKSIAEVSDLRAQLAERDATVAAMRELMEFTERRMLEYGMTTNELRRKLDHATAGRALLAKMERYRKAIETLYGFGRSACGTPDMTFDELAGLVNETCEEALKDTQ